MVARLSQVDGINHGVAVTPDTRKLVNIIIRAVKHFIALLEQWKKDS